MILVTTYSFCVTNSLIFFNSLKSLGSVASIKSYDIVDKTFLETAHAI